MLTHRLIYLLIALALTLPAIAAQPKKQPEDHVRGEQIWERSCWQCHGKENDGKGPAAGLMAQAVPDLRDTIKKPYDGYVKMLLVGTPAHPSFDSEMDQHDARRVFVYLERMDKEAKEGKKAPPRKTPADDEDDEEPDEEEPDEEEAQEGGD
jgi:mono/diheme cytochrome c family protein